MDVTSVFAAFGLSGAAGLNAWLPLFAGALLERVDAVDLAAPFDELSSTTGLVTLGVLTTADFVGDKIPAVDHVLHLVGTVIAPLSGAALFAGQTGADTDIPTLVAAIAGGTTAEAVHAGRSAIRPASTATTGGVGNPFLSLLEDIGSGLLTVFAFVVPVLAILVVIALIAGLVLLWRRAGRGLGAWMSVGPRPDDAPLGRDRLP
jgi:ABC-type thiamin/hydroxymethylpyrimidine transport system permease subunit